MTWAVPLNSIEEINAAGKILIAPVGKDFSAEEWEKWMIAYEVLNNWRAAHRFPLNTLQMNLRNSSRKIDSNALIAQRIKRLVSINTKLKLLPNMKLSQMQDIGGCRAILKDSSDVGNLLRYYETKSRMKHIKISKKDYITNPKESGYRGIHLVYRYNSEDSNSRVYNGLKIEMQIRSQLQHSWATAVETVGMFVGQALKSSIGDEQWRRFFALMSSAIALRENTPIVPNTPSDKLQLRAALNEFSTALNVQHRLRAYGETLHSITQQSERAYYYLLELNTHGPELNVTGFLRSGGVRAQLAYQDAEKNAKDNPKLDVVLVSVDSISSLQRAYPNYFADTRVFLELLKQELSGYQEDIPMPALKIG